MADAGNRGLMLSRDQRLMNRKLCHGQGITRDGRFWCAATPSAIFARIGQPLTRVSALEGRLAAVASRVFGRANLTHSGRPLCIAAVQRLNYPQRSIGRTAHCVEGGPVNPTP